MTVADVQFNPQFLMKSAGQSVDVSRFARGNPVSPGDYVVDLYVNDDLVGHTSVSFVSRPGSDNAVPRFDRALIERIGLDYSKLSPAQLAELEKADSKDGIDLAKLADGATATFDMSDLRLDLSVPQALLTHTPRGYVSPQLWDAGVPSATLGYNLNTFHTAGAGGANTQTYLGLNAGINVGNWHFRHNSSLSWQTNGPRQYQSVATYVQHDLPSLKSQLTLGDAFTDGSLFDSIGIRGVQLESDDRMFPESMRGYAPDIRGIATSNAKVTVTQNGNKLYETTVAPGPFEINDLFPTGYGGNLQVTVTESDGSQHSFTVPYASIAQLLRPGRSRFDVAAGQVRDVQMAGHANLVQATYQHGFNNFLTGYAGATASEGYMAGLLGAAVNTPIGAVALDVTQAKADIPGVAHKSGQSVRLAYSELVAPTNTDLTVAAYRYSSKGFWALRDALLARQDVADGQDPNTIDRQRGQLQLTINQSFGDRWGSFYLSGSTLDYWNRSGSTTTYQAGYSNSLHVTGYDLSYNISLSRERDGYSGQVSNQLYGSVTIPLGHSEHVSTLSASFTRSGDGGLQGQESINGTLGDSDQFSYGANANQAENSYTGGVNVQYRSPYATASASASAGSGYTQYSAGLTGALVAHPGGVTLANEMGDTMAVVEAKGAEGARITNVQGARIDSHGYAVVPYLSPYELDTIDIDPKGIPLDVELKSTSQEVAPRANSVVMVRFPTEIGRAAVISLHQPNGAPIPFGADVLDAKGRSVGMIGQGSRLFASGLEDKGKLTVKWGGENGNICSLSYQLPVKGKELGRYMHVEATCGADGSLDDKPLRMTDMKPAGSGRDADGR